MYLIFHFCYHFKLIDCKNPKCVTERVKMDKIVPYKSCPEWAWLRTWTIARASCLIGSRVLDIYAGIVKTTLDPEGDGVVQSMNSLACAPYHYWYNVKVPIYELIEWASTVEHYQLSICKTHNNDDLANSLLSPAGRTIHSPPSHAAYETEIQEALQSARQWRICLNRLWNLISASPRAEFDLPALMRAIMDTQTPQKFTHREKNLSSSTGLVGNLIDEEHDACTTDLCHFASIDSTRVVQLHKCADKTCGTVMFPVLTGTPPYVWSVSETDQAGLPKLAVKKEYMAISHVWSDGTGTGETAGRLNRCLFDYFREIAINEGHQAIWWDAISIPTERKARVAELKRMHENFRCAQVTVVHDSYATNYPWKEDGSPCIILALSPWFTRGWTALELMCSRKVKVVFQDPQDAQRQVLKDLDDEVLASHPAYCTRGHWIASTAIRRLRTRKFGSLTDLLSLLEVRSTSWPRDRIVIAALLCDLQIDTSVSNMQSDLTKQVILHFPKIDPTFLLHGHPTQESLGIFSWCPSTIFLGGKPFVAPDFTPAEWLSVSKDGTISGTFWARCIGSCGRSLIPATAHISARWKVQTALENEKHLLLIWPISSTQSRPKDPAILVTAIAIGSNLSDNDVVDCRREGIVLGGLAIEDQPPNFLFEIDIRLGRRDDKPSQEASELVRHCSSKDTTIRVKDFL